MVGEHAAQFRHHHARLGAFDAVDQDRSVRIARLHVERAVARTPPRRDGPLADAERNRSVRVVGKHCESGDLLVREGWVPGDLEVGDVLATPVTGAYGYAMGSNYNHVLRPAVVFVADGDARLVIRREIYEDLVRREA